MPDKVTLSEKFARFQDLWSPKVVGEVNGHLVKLVKIRGEFIDIIELQPFIGRDPAERPARREQRQYSPQFAQRETSSN